MNVTNVEPMILVFDTNVFLQPQANLWELMEHFPTNQSPPKFLVAVDDGEGWIENEYLEQAIRAFEVDTTGGPEAPVRVVTERILDGTALFVVRSSAKLSDMLAVRLEENFCTKPIEPQLFGVSESIKGILVCPNDIPALIPRHYLNPGVIHHIQYGGVGPTVLSLAEVLKPIRSPHEYRPATILELQEILRSHRGGIKSGEEREYLEFKKPEGTCLSQEMLRDAVQAVCGMLNSRDGWVIIGVDDESGEIVPFLPKYKSSSKSANVDQLIRDIYCEIDRICPKPGCLVSVWPILDDEGQNCVIVINVQRGNRDYVYRDRNTGKLNSMKWIRNGPRTIPDPSWC
jgi:hypothetical protein